MAPAGEMAQLVTMMSGQNSLCRDAQQDYTKGGRKEYHLIFGFISFFFFQLKKERKKTDKESQTKTKEGN